MKTPSQNKQLLVLTYKFPPYWTTGIVRCTKMVKYLAQNNWTVTVITARRLFTKNKVRMNEPFSDSVRIHRILLALPDIYAALLHVMGGLFRALGLKRSPQVKKASAKEKAPVHSFERIYRPSLQKRLERFFFPMDPEILWAPFAFVYAFFWLLFHGSCRRIWITSPPFSQLLIGLALKLFFWRLRLVSDFRDHWTEDINRTFVTPLHRWLEKKAEAWVLEKSDHVVFVSEIHRDWALQQGLSGKRISLIYNGFDPDDIKDLKPTEKTRVCTLRYFGGIGEARNIAYLLEAIDELKKSGELERAGFKMEFYGEVYPYFRQLAKDMELDDAVSFHPPLSYRDALASMRGATALLLVIDHDPYTSCYPTKFFEYLAARRPIFSLGPCRGAAQYVVRQNIGFQVVEEDKDQIKSILTQLIEKHQKGLLVDHELNIEEFNRVHQARQLSDLLVSLS